MTRDLRRKYHKVNKYGVHCRLEARREQKRLCEQQRRKNGSIKPRNGTGTLGPTPHPTIEQEQKAIKSEQYYLQLRRRPKKYS